MAKLDTRDLREREQEMLKSFILSESAGEAHHVYSETATYISTGKGIKGSNTGDRRKRMRTEFPYPMD